MLMFQFPLRLFELVSGSRSITLFWHFAWLVGWWFVEIEVLFIQLYGVNLLRSVLAKSLVLGLWEEDCRSCYYCITSEMACAFAQLVSRI